MPQKMTLQLNPMFVKDNPVCRAAWALCAIATDLHFEAPRIGAHIPGDARHAFHERLYFFRGTIRGLFSAQKLLNQLRGDPVFREMAERHGHYEAFEENRRQVAQCATEFIGYRNRYAAHTEGDVGQSLEKLHANTTIVLEAHEVPELPRHIGVVAFLSAVRAELGVPEEQENAALFAMLERMVKATDACVKCINVVVAVTHAEYGVPPTWS